MGTTMYMWREEVKFEDRTHIISTGCKPLICWTISLADFLLFIQIRLQSTEWSTFRVGLSCSSSL